MNFPDFFFEVNFIGSKTLNLMPWIWQSSEIKSITESFWGSRWEVHLDGLSNYLYSFWKQPASSFFKNNNYSFPDQGNVGHHIKKVTEKGANLFIKYIFRLILCGYLLPRKHLLLHFTLISNKFENSGDNCEEIKFFKVSMPFE